jgi:hypothetical protein
LSEPGGCGGRTVRRKGVLGHHHWQRKAQVQLEIPAVTLILNTDKASLAGKWLELLKEIDPKISRTAVAFDPKTSPGGGAYYLRLI